MRQDNTPTWQCLVARLAVPAGTQMIARDSRQVGAHVAQDDHDHVGVFLVRGADVHDVVREVLGYDSTACRFVSLRGTAVPEGAVYLRVEQRGFRYGFAGLSFAVSNVVIDLTETPKAGAPCTI